MTSTCFTLSRRALALALVAGALVAGSPVAPLAAQEQPAWPKGEVLKFTFSNSKIFPGTVRDCWVYVPKQYDGETPACVHVNQDGVQFNAPAVFDELIHKKEIPVLIGVFVMHGRVRAADESKALDRFNRSYEYDGLGDNYVRFILEEIFPEVEKQKTADGRAIKLSKNGNDRSIGGSSSGAVCAFTAAWERPDAFSRVFSSIGTYVGLRGANDYPTLLRKTEPKPLRIFLQDGTNDLNIYAGDWWMVNQEMERALVFSGYEVDHVWDEGKHNNEGGTRTFPQGMKFLWKNWPEPIKAGQGPPGLKDRLIPGEGWKVVATTDKHFEGLARNAQGEVFVNEGGKIVKLTGETPTTFIEDNSKGDGQAFGPDGRLYAVARAKNQIIAYSPDGKPTVIAEGIAGNDLVVRNDGNIYITAPGANPAANEVIFVAPNGDKKVVDTGLKFPNGIALSTDQTLLYVSDYRSHWVYSYQIQADGTLAYKQKYYHLHVPDTADDAGGDGLAVDEQGWLYVTTRMGLQLCDQPGRVNAIIPTPNGKCSSVEFGGPAGDVLYVTAGNVVYSRKLKVKGAVPFGPSSKPNKPGL